MVTCVESFSATYDGERVRLVAGRDRVGAEHELVRRFPAKFGKTAMRSSRSHSRGADAKAEPAHLIPLEEELRRRSAWLAEIERRAQRRASRRRRSADPERAFWDGVERLLGEPALNPKTRREQAVYDTALSQMQSSDSASWRREREAVESLWRGRLTE
jgi:hypothetical protein